MMEGRHFRETYNQEKDIKELAVDIPYSKWKESGGRYKITQKQALKKGKPRDRHTVYAKWNRDSYIFRKIVDFALEKGQTEVVYGERIKSQKDYHKIYHRFWTRLDELRDKLGIELEYHQFRHNRATELAEKQQRTYVLKDFHGWKNPETAKEYVESTGQLARQASDKIE